MSNCICIAVDNDTYYDWSSSWEVSDGAVKCCECHETIPAGERFKEERCYINDPDSDDYPDDPEVDIYKTCWICAQIRDDYFECGWWYGRIWEDLEENLEADESCEGYRVGP
jgi:hypothetical protein